MEEYHFKSPKSRLIFEFLKAEYTKDDEVLRVPLDKCGWRSVVQIAQETGFPAKTLYGSSPGHLGAELQDLLKDNLVEMRYFSGERGRGGEVMRFRISDPEATIQKRKQSQGTDQEIVEAPIVPQIHEISNQEKQIIEQGQRHLATIMFTDMVGYTALGQRNESLSLVLLEEQRKIIRPVLMRHNGREIKTMGDAFLVEFPNALDAVRCAYDIQRATREFNISIPEEKRIHLRVGLHLGDVVESEGDISGDAVNVASRIESIAEGGGVCLTRQVYDEVRNKIELTFTSLGERSFKNVALPIEVYRIDMPWDSRELELTQKLAIHRIAVLPFASLSPDPNDEFFADGLTDELITRLSLLSGLEVIARTSVMSYKNREKGANQIGKELRAGTLVEGSVRKAGNRIRVTAQLIDSNNESHLWADSYDRNLEDIFSVQSDIAERVASSLRVNITAQEKKRIEKKSTQNMDAHNEYLKGKVIAVRWDRNSLSTAVKHFEKAIALDPDFPLAYCGLSMIYSKLAFQDAVNPSEAYEKAQRYALKAMELDESLPEAYLYLVAARLNTYDFATREDNLKKALSLNPNLAEAHMLLANHYAYMNRWDEVVMEIEKALQLDPLSVDAMEYAGTWYLYAGRYDDAIRCLKEVLELDPSNSQALDNMGLAHIQKGMVEQGLEEIKRAVKAQNTPTPNGDLAYAYVKAGRPEEAKKVLAELQKPDSNNPVPSTTIAGIYAVLGEKEKALQWLEKAYDERSGYLPSIAADFVYDNLHAEPRFLALLSKMGLNKPTRIK